MHIRIKPTYFHLFLVKGLLQSHHGDVLLVQLKMGLLARICYFSESTALHYEQKLLLNYTG